jgi:hypothetical protein
MFWSLEFSRKISEPSAMFWMRGDPPTGRNEDTVARKMVQKSRVACVRCFGCMWFKPEMLHRKYNNRNMEACQTDLSTLFGWNQRCPSIFSCACDVLGSWNPLLKRWIACWLRIHIKGDQTCEMKAQGSHKLLQTFTCGPNNCGIACLCALDVRGTADCPLSIALARRKSPSVYLSGKLGIN